MLLAWTRPQGVVLLLFLLLGGYGGALLLCASRGITAFRLVLSVVTLKVYSHLAAARGPALPRPV